MTKHKRHLAGFACSCICICSCTCIRSQWNDTSITHTLGQVNASCLAGHEIELEVEFGFGIGIGIRIGASHVSERIVHC